MPYATVDGTRVRYLEAGSGPPVVLLHAFPLTAEMWEAQIDALADRWRVIAPDLAPELEPDPSMDAMADTVAALLRNLDVDQAVVAGLSMGGYVTFAFLRRHRSLARAVVLADTRSGADTAEVRERRTAQQEQVRAGDVAGVRDDRLATLLSEDTRQHRPDVVAHARAIADQVPPDSIVAALEAMKRRPDSTPDLAGLDLPALVVVGEHDGPSPPDVADEMAQRLPNARLAVVPGAGHLSNLEAPEAFTRALRAFLETL
jgi:pimeloyl-ACP methyl ester carboxylesterase